MSAISIPTNISKMVDQYGRCEFKTILAEAFSNSIQAKATDIKCNIFGDNFDTVEIIDNGEGFNRENVESFKTFLSEYKKDSYGSKGIGRLTFLYLYRDVNIESYLLIDKKPTKTHIKFDTENWVQDTTYLVEDSKNFSQQTILKLSGYRRERRGKQINLESTVAFLKSHLMPMIILKPNINVSITYNQKQENYEISKDDIPPNLDVQTIKIKNFDFKISMAISESEKSVCEAHYVAGYRTAGSIPKIRSISGYMLYCLVESKFLDDRVNDSRDKIDFPSKNDDLFLSQENIDDEVYKVLQKYIESKKPQIFEKNKKDREKVIEDEPYLSEYVSDDPLLSEDEILRDARKQYQKDKEDLLTIRTRLREQLKSDNVPDSNVDDYLDKAIEMGTKLLAEYINDRHSIINILEKLDQRKENIEKRWHNLFMPQKSDELIDNNELYIPAKKHNLWLIDDRFMTYKYVASDVQIKTILGKLTDIEPTDSRDRPDLSIFISDQDFTDKAVIVELKPYGITPYDKEKGIQQLLNYAEIFKEKLKSTQQWYYLITDIDEDFEKLLRRNDFKKVFTHGDVMYFKYNENADTHIYVMSYKSLIADAKARNQVFLDQFIKSIPNP